MQRRINKVAVLGSGVMGSRIACHFANIGVEVLLLDIVPNKLSEKEEKAGLTLESSKVRNRIVNDALTAAIKSNPSPLYRKSFAKRITTGNLEDDLSKIIDCDWVIEVVIERLDIKKDLLTKVDELRADGTLITTNTSGIPINDIMEGRSKDFQEHFCGTHFFNPPRYLALLELIPSKSTKPEIIDFLKDYGRRYLGKEVVICKDTPAFIANRIGVFSIMSLFHSAADSGLTVDEIDTLTGPVLGRPKSATFRTCDVVGLDTLVHVANGVRENCPDDERNDLFAIPDYISSMLEQNKLGSKTGEGFYKKFKKDGKSEIQSLDLKSLEYAKRDKRKFATIGAARAIDDVRKRMPVLYNGQDEAGAFYRQQLNQLFSYVSFRIPEISDNLYSVDDAMRAGFGWELGPFELWEAIGVKAVADQIKKDGLQLAPWVDEMLSSGIEKFYDVLDSSPAYYDPNSKSMASRVDKANDLSLRYIKSGNTIWENAGASIIDLGDDVINLEFHTKMNVIGAEIIEGINKAIDMAEKEKAGIVIYNEGANFSAGANVGMIFMLAVEQDLDELNMAVKTFQDTMMRIRYSSIPVVISPHALTLGGGCEMCLHADKVIAHAETYMGLVEFGIGVIPGGGGTKEFAVRTSDEFREGDIRINTLRNRFLTIGQAKVATSGHEAFDLGYLREGIDEVIVSRADQLAYSKNSVLHMANKGYSKPVMRNDITVLGNEGMGIVHAGANSMLSGNYISEHDALISEKLGGVMCGGDLSEMQEVSEQYLLDLERKVFLELCQTRKTVERMEHFIKSGKILRN